MGPRGPVFRCFVPFVVEFSSDVRLQLYKYGARTTRSYSTVLDIFSLWMSGV
jgi:hypothetical protein